MFPLTAFFLVWYGLYAVLGAFATEFMAVKAIGNVNIGLLLELGQFVTTFVITGRYVRFADRQLDPRAVALRAKLEGGAS